ncbi:hypothetical protein MJO29_004905 [Puccinia striiformis f. sp. tritici]|nr:hypothetical protein MJO29_004905 [Puccinia striiformis f. sp. tritici]
MKVDQEPAIIITTTQKKSLRNYLPVLCVTMIERLISPAVQFCARSDTIRPEKPAAESSNDSDDDELKKPVAAKVKRESLARQSRPEAQVISTFLIGFYRMLLKVLPLLGRLK